MLPYSTYVPAVAVPGACLRKGCVVRTKLQRAIVAVLEERLAINAEEFFRLLNGDPSWVLSHDQRSRVHRYLTPCQEAVNSLKKNFISLLNQEQIQVKLK